MKIYKPDFNTKGLKDLPMDVRINKVIDLLDTILNTAFSGCHEYFYYEIHNILQDKDNMKKIIIEEIEDENN